MNHEHDEDEINPKAHKRLLREVANLSKVQHIKKPTRTEPTSEFDEFQLVKRVEGKHVPVRVNELVKVLGKTGTGIEVGKELKVLAAKKVLPKPLDKPIEDRVQRKVGYHKAKNQLQRWSGVVARIRNADCKIFPLKHKNDIIEKSASEKPELCIKPMIMEEFEKIEEKYKMEPEDEKKSNAIIKQTVSKEELAARRRELYYLKLKQSQKSAKEYRRNKIKSKRYRKLLKRQKLKEQIDEFERLQKTDPKAAEEKLKLIEKNRVLERASLRHKNTGLWAKNQQIKAKYNTEIRKNLAEQLSLSRQLTQKKEIAENNDDWYEKNDDTMEIEMKKSNIGLPNPWVRSKLESNQKENLECSQPKHNVGDNEIKGQNNVKKSKTLDSSASEWIVEEIDPDCVTKMSVDDIFDLSENKEFTKVTRKQKKNKNPVEKSENKKKAKASVMPPCPSSSSNPNVTIDETARNIDATCVAEIKTPTILQNATIEMSMDDDLPEDANFDKQLAMVEAFEDDEIIKDFTKEKNDIEASKLAEQELDLTIAGWGSWAGNGIPADNLNRQKQLKLKFQSDEDTDSNKKMNPGGDKKFDRVIRTNVVNKKLREHLVSDIPFPFKSVHDFEASIRAPLGRTFIPETATRLLTKPKLITRSGQIIKPIDESEIMAHLPGKKRVFIS